MTLTQVWGSLVIFLVCPLLGGLPLIAWIFRGLTGQRLAQLGTGNVSVSAAFYHGGRWIGILAVLSEALKGIAAVLIARAFFPTDPTWELIALIALVMGRYWMGRGAGTTNVVWGYIIHDWIAAGLVFLISGISFTILRERRQGRLGTLVLLPLITAFRHPYEGERVGAAIALSILLGWIYQKIPDDLDMPTGAGTASSQATFRFFQGDRALISLDQSLAPEKVGQKAATLSQLKRWGYPVPMGWVLPPGDDPAPLIEALDPSAEKPLVVRSSAIGEDSDIASAAGQYDSILNVTSRPTLEQAIVTCLASYSQPAAAQYRQHRGLPEGAMAVLVQKQVQGTFSGVAFSRDPISRQGDAVVIEGLPGAATQVVSGQVTPEQYQVLVRGADLPTGGSEDWVMPDNLKLEVEGEGDLPPRLIEQVAFLARHIESRYHGVPQDIEWSYDGQTLWLLQARPITTLLPIWTRKIAAEVIPGLIRPLTWSVNRPLTCGVWGEIFTLVLGERARGLNFNETATLHHSHAYFNASLLGEIFLRMGLPPESLEFLTRGAKFSKPPLTSTLKNVPGLLKLVSREWQLEKDFAQDQRQYFSPGLEDLAQQPVSELSPTALLGRVDYVLELLKRATYYSILAPLSTALRQAMYKVADAELDNHQTPEVASLRSLQSIAEANRPFLNNLDRSSLKSSTLLSTLAETPEGQAILTQFNQFLSDYGYLSDVGTDIAVPTWSENPQPVQELFVQVLLNPLPAPQATSVPKAQGWKVKQVQRRLNLKGQVTTVYSRLIAELRWSFVALEAAWLKAGILAEPGDLFFLKFDEIRQIIETLDSGKLVKQLPQLIAARRSQLEQDHQSTPPALVYGNEPAILILPKSDAPLASSQELRGIGASPGQAQGRVKVLHNLQSIPEIDSGTILVVPYTDSGWAPLLARAGGLIAEVGGRLSHGAIVAREYGIPAVMDIHNATQRLRDGQWVRIDGQQGIVEIL